jgi:hypothetical protein
MIELLKRLLGDTAERDERDPDEMPISEVWDELVRTVRPPGEPKIIKTLSSPDFAHVRSWLEPPTACPMAKAALRSLVGLQRSRQWSELGELNLVYIGESDQDLEPPQESMEGVGGLCRILNINGTIYWPVEFGSTENYNKVDITLNR